MTDGVNPSYYKDGWSNDAEVIDITENLTSNGGQAVQYIARSTRLDGNSKGDVLEDLHKAKWFVEREIQRLEQFELFPFVPESDAFFIEHMTAPVQPRVWRSLTEVQEGLVVKGPDGSTWEGEGSYGSSEYDIYGPFTEVVESE